MFGWKRDLIDIIVTFHCLIFNIHSSNSSNKSESNKYSKQMILILETVAPTNWIVIPSFVLNYL